MLSEELKAIDELIMLKHFLETEEKYEGQEREVKAIDTVLNLITKLQKENEEVKRAINVVEKEKKQWIEENNQKDKQIDLIVEYIATLDIEDDICSKIGKEYCDQMNFGECENCIKQYFERKCEE